ncbi:MAG: AtpZ/AtpI family protein, partial [Acidobacteriaceae bacterium]
KYYGLALLLPISMAVGFGIGYLLDRAFGTTFLKLVFLLLGIASGIIELVRELAKDDGGK